MMVGCAESLNCLGHHELVEVFNRVFLDDFATQLIGGGQEPIYLPADSESPVHRIVFTLDYAASALHEVAHWLVAGDERREQVDYGYWYAPDGRTLKQQIAFEKVEVKPQAIEWLLSVASGRPFRVSADNLDAGLGASSSFKRSIFQQVLMFIESGVNDRTQAFIEALEQQSGCSNTLNPNHYCVGAL